MINLIKKTFLYIFLKKLKYRLMSIKFKTNKNNIIQTASTTFMNRHPDIFEFLKEKYKEKDVRILSFGCSTGEECFSIRKYMPKAHIIGVDINPQSIKTANENPLKDSKMEFIKLNPSELFQIDKCDVILALSVLCKNPEAQELKDIKAIYPFSRYDLVIKQLDEILQKDGTIIIRSSNFRFRDSSVFNKYEVISYEKQRVPKYFPKFDSKNKRIENFLEKEEFFLKNIE